jgi:membrane-associated protein
VNLLDANSVISTLGLIGVLGIIFMETGLLIGLVFPGGEVVFLAGIAASGSGAAALGEAKLSTPLLFTLAPVAAIVGGEVGYWFGRTYGRKFFDRPESRFFNQKMVQKIEKWLVKYGPRKALVCLWCCAIRSQDIFYLECDRCNHLDASCNGNRLLFR